MRDFIAAAKAISDPNRVRILKMLEKGELCVCYLAERLGLAQSTVSKHLALLRQAGLVADRKEGLWVYYRLETEPITAHNLSFLDLVRHSLKDDPQVCEDAEKVAGLAAVTPPSCYRQMEEE
ncbi:MAG: winged helix-turn-helix transcriptional regulator [Chloroflexi bacterium]|nr:winged helix-turn-helix transcriptional regulator [Chloroflexota bacterium]